MIQPVIVDSDMRAAIPPTSGLYWFPAQAMVLFVMVQLEIVALLDNSATIPPVG